MSLQLPIQAVVFKSSDSILELAYIGMFPQDLDIGHTKGSAFPNAVCTWCMVWCALS